MVAYTEIHGKLPGQFTERLHDFLAVSLSLGIYHIPGYYDKFGVYPPDGRKNSLIFLPVSTLMQVGKHHEPQGSFKLIAAYPVIIYLKAAA